MQRARVIKPINPFQSTAPASRRNRRCSGYPMMTLARPQGWRRAAVWIGLQRSPQGLARCGAVRAHRLDRTLERRQVGPNLPRHIQPLPLFVPQTRAGSGRTPESQRAVQATVMRPDGGGGTQWRSPRGLPTCLARRREQARQTCAPDGSHASKKRRWFTSVQFATAKPGTLYRST